MQRREFFGLVGLPSGGKPSIGPGRLPDVEFGQLNYRIPILGLAQSMGQQSKFGGGEDLT
jgi:hypothetical protein